MTNFNFNSDSDWTVFTNNPSYLQTVVDRAFAYNNRPKPTKIENVGKVQDSLYAVKLDIQFVKVRRSIKDICGKQQHSVVIFPTYVGSSSDSYKATFKNVVGNWGW